MFTLSEIKELIKLVDESSLQELEIENEGSRLMIRKPNKTEQLVVSAAQIPAAAYAQASVAPAFSQPAVQAPDALVPSAAESNLHTIVSPMVGTFYAAPSPDAPSFVTKGSVVKEKTIVCIVEAMKLMNEIEAEVKGEIVEILVENGQLVEYGQPLFLVKPE